jgi:site-specific recombinase XerD
MFDLCPATHLHGKIDLKSLQTVLGHKNIQITQGYVKQTVQDLKAELSFDLLDEKNRR